MNSIASLETKISIHVDSVAYWGKLGVHIESGCCIYPSSCLGSEPYLYRNWQPCSY